MARSLPTTVVQAMNRQSTDALFLVLMTITHSDITTVRLVNNTEDVTSGGDVYQAFPFSVILPPDDEDEPAVIRVTMANVTRRLVSEARTIAGKAELALADIELIEHSAPDTVLASWTDFEVHNVRYDASALSFDLSPQLFLNVGFPGDSMTKGNTPGLH